ncbi:MAG: phosphatidate cytidylyltransferase [Burkholderiaceae bacterium]|jgi:phosphatidate cytidylyltransferase|nr:phosphatidate cytidylyltransferase [Burkholderiaceae bacterium]
MLLSLHETFFAALAGVVVLFTVATALGSWLESRTVDAIKLAWIHQLNLRIRGSWSIVLLFALAFALGGEALTVVFAAASFFAMREFVALTPTRGSDYWALVIAFYVAIPLQYVLVAGGLYEWYAVMIPVYLFLLLPMVMALRQDIERFLERVAKVQWGLMISVYCVSHAPAIATLQIPGYEERGALLLLYFLLVLQMSELLAVIASASVGRTPLKSNPSKSVEGVLLGGIAATGVGTLLWWMTPFAWWQSLLMSAAIVVAGFMGGLVLASVKRSLGARDLWLEGGVQLARGALGRLDALAFAAPVFFHLTLFFFAR